SSRSISTARKFTPRPRPKRWKRNCTHLSEAGSSRNSRNTTPIPKTTRRPPRICAEKPPPMRAFALLAILFALAVGARAATLEESVIKQLVPTGKLRVGVAYAPALTPTFVVKEAGGAVRGVPRDLGEALAEALGVPIELFVA